MYRLLTTALLIIGTVWLVAPVAGAQAADVAEALRGDPVYVAPDAEEADRSRLEDAIAAAARIDLDVRVAVLSSGDGEALANGLLAELPGTTVVVFTASSYGVASDEVSQGRLDAALSAAADELTGSDAANGLAAFVEALDPDDGGVSVGLIVVGGLAILLVVGVGGRMWETRTREKRQARRRDRRRDELRDRAERMGSRVVDLSDRVELAESPEASRAFAEATGIFAATDGSLTAAATMKDLDAIEADLDRAMKLMNQAEAATRV